MIQEFGESRGLDLLTTLRSLEADFYDSEAHLTEPGQNAMTDRAADEVRARHPDLPSAVVDALAWCYSFDYR